MKLPQKHTHFLLEAIRFLFILLFVYAAVSKLLDYENFRVQLGQSPLLTAFAPWVAWGVPGSEIVIAGMLFIPRLRVTGFYAAFALMVMFTTYIVIILNFTDFIPCSCGGVLEKLGWTEHLIFNLVFVGLAAVGVWFATREERYDLKMRRESFLQKNAILKLVVTLTLLIVVGVGLVAFLFLISREIERKHNAFSRFPHHPIKQLQEMTLDFNSYYLDRAGEGKMYLGNTRYTIPFKKLRAHAFNNTTAQ
jgi:uncharacterized membrane protein YphA (DoxX/SURF4 family)